MLIREPFRRDPSARFAPEAIDPADDVWPLCEPPGWSAAIWVRKSLKTSWLPPWMGLAVLSDISMYAGGGYGNRDRIPAR